MKKLLILLFSILISFNSYGEWREIVKNTEGDIFYVDLDTVKGHGGYVYFWNWIEYLKPMPSGYIGGIVYFQGDCGAYQQKGLTASYYKNPMLKDQGDSFTPPDEWIYTPPNSTFRYVLDYVCDYVK